MSLLPSGAIETGGYDINNSLRFRASGSTYLNRTFGSTYTDKTKSTVSFWVKRGSLNINNGHTIMWYNASGASGHITFAGSGAGGTLVNDCLNFSNRNATTGSGDYGFQTTQLFRDPSAWYHIMIVFDTGQATSTNRVKLYVNGTQVTSFVSTQYPSQNYQTTAFLGGNSTAHIIGYGATTGATEYFDGYLAETHFVDGQALTPSSFGETDAVTGVWKAKKYTGTYGTNGFYLPFKNNTTSTHAGTFNGSNQYLSAPDNAVFSWGTGSFTIEGWIKTSTKTNYTCIVAKSNAGATDSFYVETDSGGYIHYGTNGGISLQGTKDVCDGNWHHFAVVRNGSTNLTLYIDGISNATGSDTNSVSSGFPLTIGYLSSSFPRYFNGQISNLRIVKGTAVYTSNFVPSSTALTAISNTSILTLQNATIIDNSTNAFTITNNGTVTTSTVTPFVANIASDNSGNNNNWFTNNINYTTAGSTYDAMTDSPTNTSATVANYAVINPLDVTTATISNANLTMTSTSAAHRAIRASIGISSGKWYWEQVFTGANQNGACGVGTNTASLATYVGGDANSWGYYPANGLKYNNGSGTSYGATYAANDIIGIAFDADAGTLVFYKNNVSQGTAYTLTTGVTYYPMLSQYNSDIWNINFGQRPFSYTPPTGFVALNTYNLPDSTIKKGNSYMDATAYTGTNGSPTTQVISSNFQPDFLWFKKRSASYDHALIDTNRGITKQLYSNLTNAEGTDSDVLTAIGASSFTVGNSNYSNYGTLVAWTWKANGGTTSSNTAGSITSTVQANTTAGFSIVTYTGTGANATVGHGLGVAPRMIICKNRASATDWAVYHASFGNTGALRLNSTIANEVDSRYWNNTTPTSTVFSVGSSSTVNGSSNTQVAYCWAAIPGYSAFGSYTGNGSSDGPFVYLGFRPRWVMWKNASAVSYWWIMDSSINPYNPNIYILAPNANIAEYTDSNLKLDFLSNGFKPRTLAGNEVNGSGNTIIYAAFAENPFKNSLAR